jgi:hypothetical protein
MVSTMDRQRHYVGLKSNVLPPRPPRAEHHSLPHPFTSSSRGPKQRATSTTGRDRWRPHHSRHPNTPRRTTTSSTGRRGRFSQPRHAGRTRGPRARRRSNERLFKSGFLQDSCSIEDEEFFVPRPIDNSSCGLEGGDDEDDAHKLQNRVKNNFCASGFLTNDPTDDPVRVTQFSFRKLEEETIAIRKKPGISLGTVREDRTLFQQTVHTTSFGDDVGEGTLVRYVGFLLEGHFTGEEG